MIRQTNKQKKNTESFSIKVEKTYHSSKKKKP